MNAFLKYLFTDPDQQNQDAQAKRQAILDDLAKQKVELELSGLKSEQNRKQEALNALTGLQGDYKNLDLAKSISGQEKVSPNAYSGPFSNQYLSDLGKMQEMKPLDLARQRLMPYGDVEPVKEYVGGLETQQNRQDAIEAAKQKAEEDRKAQVERDQREFEYKKELAKIAAGNKPNQEEKTDFTQEQQLTSQFHTEIKDFKAAKNSFKNIENVYEAQQSKPTAANDVSLIYSIAKMYDPIGVVRESDYDAVAKSVSVPTQVKVALNKALSGQKLDPQSRTDFYNNAKTIYSGYHSTFKDIKGFYDKKALEYGLSPDRVTGGVDYEPKGASKSSGTVKISTDADYEKLPSGTVFIGPDGKQRRKP